MKRNICLKWLNISSIEIHDTELNCWILLNFVFFLLIPVVIACIKLNGLLPMLHLRNLGLGKNSHCIKYTRIWVFLVPYYLGSYPYTGKYGSGKTRILAYFTQCNWTTLTISWRRSLLHRKQSIYLQSK